MFYLLNFYSFLCGSFNSVFVLVERKAHDHINIIRPRKTTTKFSKISMMKTEKEEEENERNAIENTWIRRQQRRPNKIVHLTTNIFLSVYIPNGIQWLYIFGFFYFRLKLPVRLGWYCIIFYCMCTSRCVLANIYNNVFGV